MASSIERNRSGLGRLLRSALLGAIVYGCGGMAGGPSSGGESHFLEYCEASCDGLDCIAGVCTRGCLVGESACGDLSSAARCTDSSIEPGVVAVCDVACEATADCASLGPEHRCTGGFCRRGTAPPAPAGSCRVAHRSYAPGATGIPAPQGCGTCSWTDGGLDCVEGERPGGAERHFWVPE